MPNEVFNVDAKLFCISASNLYFKTLYAGQTKHRITYDKFNGDRQSVSAWIDFIIDAVARKYSRSIGNTK
jgi:hypothetical protein